LAFFRGEMSLNELLNTSKKRIDNIVEARKQRIVDESKSISEKEEAMKRQAIQNQILAK
jgi:hypothetical protein